jgi:hypothetical protein
MIDQSDNAESMTPSPQSRIADSLADLKSTDPEKRLTAVEELTALDPWKFWETCGGCLVDADPLVRGRTLHYFFDVLMDSHFSGEDRLRWVDQILPHVIPLVSDPVGPVAFNAISVLELTAPYSDVGLGEVIGALNDTRLRWLRIDARISPEQNYSVQWNAASALGEFGARAAKALPALRQLTNSPDERTRIVAAESIAKISAMLAGDDPNR